MQSILYCPICGSKLRFQKACPICGYEQARDYEVYPTLGIIPRSIVSVPAKRKEYEKQQLREEVYKILQPFRVQQEERVRKAEEAVDLVKKELEQVKHEAEHETAKLKQRLTFVETLIKEGRGSSAEASASAPKLHPALITINNTCTFGSYPQDADGTVRPILWRVLKEDKVNHKALLISKYALDCQPYNTTRKDVTWGICTLRNWLNSTFLNNAFSDKEREMIPKVIVSADSNPDYIRAAQGSSTKDQIFLLSIPEVRNYFSTDKERQCSPTAYAVKKGAWISSKHKQDDRKTGVWWLRSVSGSSFRSTLVRSDGYVNTQGSLADFVHVSVRPALWVNLE